LRFTPLAHKKNFMKFFRFRRLNISKEKSQ
jgi:hypothetical protein